MLWIFLALLAHMANGAVFIVDKSLLAGRSALSRPLQYALYSAALAVCAVVLLPFASIVVTPFVIFWAVIAGFIHIIALYVFFVAMRFGEPSRIVPITGSAVPLFTILFAVIFLGEVFTFWQYVGILLLIVGGAFLSIRRTTYLLLPVLAGVLFAAYFVITKHMYTNAEAQFLSVFIATRVIEGVMALCAIAVVVPLSQNGRGSIALAGGVRGKGARGSSFIFFLNKVLAAGAFLLQSYAISLGSVSIVNALQGVQFVIVFLLAMLFSTTFPKIFTEDMGASAILQKTVGIICMSIGITLIA